ncbi:MAG: hypothetical protein OEW17_05130 [Gemmatimonadota bacterium]|nr:hypothetical protein [Gemmatimonadota bacterium]MDH4348165.1 hypothetical protein [Gemmatimonadota bacterium]
MRISLFVAAFLAVHAAPARAQDTAAAAPVTARPADVASEDAIIAALYDVISGPAGTPRDWNRMRSLFAPGARLIPTGKRRDGTWFLVNWDVEEYITRAGSQLEADGFFEREIARQSERYGNMAHAFSSYESRHAEADSLPFARGINSIQLRSDGTRWWVVTVLWEGERPDNPIPARYLTSNGD